MNTKNIIPRAVMIHFSDAPLANPAMMCPWWSISLASVAHSPVISIVAAVVIAGATSVYVRKVHLTLWQWHNSWIAENGLHVRHHQHQNNCIERHHVKCPPQTIKPKISVLKISCKFQIYDLPVQHCVHNDPPHHNIIRIEYCNVGDDNAHHSAGIFHKHSCLSSKLTCLMTSKIFHFFTFFLVKKKELKKMK